MQRNPQPRTRDTISVILRDGYGAPYGILQNIKVYLDSATSGSKKFGRKSISLSLLERSNPYYIVVQKRNSISSWSNLVSTIIDSLVYDFTIGIPQTFGNNAIIVNSTASFYTGDVNQDGVVDGSDAAQIDNDAFNFATGNYLTTDLNWDGIVDGSDAALVDNKAFTFVGEVKPTGASSISSIVTFYDNKQPAGIILFPDPYVVGKNKNIMNRNYE